jgi:hypothetical protein
VPTREFARIGTDMPDEKSIKALNVAPQWLYDRLLLRGEMSRCGVIPYRPALWSELAPDATEQKIRRWVRDLTTNDPPHVVVDERYQEAFIRTYVRHDGLLGQPNVVANMCSDFRLIASDRIRVAFLAEFRRIWDLPIPRTWRGGWLLAVGEYPAVKTHDGAWPDVLPAGSLDRLRKALKDTGILGPLLAAIHAGHVDPFTEASPEGLPEALADATPIPPAYPSGNPSPNPLRGRAGGRDRGESLVPSPGSDSGPERRAPSASPNSEEHTSPLSSNDPYHASHPE